MRIKRFTYKQLYVNREKKNLIDVLNEEGKSGWEAISIMVYDMDREYFLCILKKEIE